MMDLRTTLAFCVLNIAWGTGAQYAPELEWQRALGGTGFYGEQAFDVEQTPDGGYVVVGFSDSNNGDVSGNHGGTDLWVVRLDVTGGIVWQRSFGGAQHDKGYAIDRTSDGGFIVAGSSASSDGDVSGAHGYLDGWLIKLSTSGTLEWQKTLGGGSDEELRDVHQTADGGYIAAGYTSSNNGDVVGWHSATDYWLVKLNSAGEITWQKPLGGDYYEEAYEAVQTSDGGYVIVGFSESLDGDVTGQHGVRDVWVAKVGTNGTLQWQKALGGSFADTGFSVRQTSDGGYIVAGWTSSNDGDVSSYSGNEDVWLVRLTSAGAIQWQNTLGGTGLEEAHALQAMPGGGFLIAGIAGNSDGDVTGNHGEFDFWLVRTDDQGELVWQKCLGGNARDWCEAVSLTSDGGFVAAGFSRTSNNGDLTGAHGGDDAWVVKLATDGTGLAENVRSQFSIAPVPSTGGVRVDCAELLTNATVVVSDAAGRPVFRVPLNGHSALLELGALARGPYSVAIISTDVRCTGRLVLE